MSYMMKPVAPVEVSVAARAAAEAYTKALPLDTFFPTFLTNDLNFKFQVGGKTRTDMAEYRAFDAEAPMGREYGSITQSGQLPPISRQLPISELSQLRLSGGGDAELKAAIVGKAESLGESIAVRLEKAKADALVNGKITIAENGMTATVDFGRNAALAPTLAGTKTWDKAAATPIDDIEKWRRVLRETGNAVGSTAIMTQDVMVALSKSPDIAKAAYPGAAATPSRVSYSDVRAVLSDYGVYNVIVVDEAYSKFQLPAPLFPAGTFILTGPGAVGTTTIGIPAEALNAEYGLPKQRRAGIFAGAMGRSNPEGIYVLASAIALPVLDMANTVLYAKVV